MPRLGFALLLITALVLALLAPARPSEAANGDPTSPAEQLFIYELNLIRWNPVAYGIQAPPTPPLAINAQLAAAADIKAAYMINPAGSPTVFCGHSEPAWSNQLAVEQGFPLPTWWANASGDYPNNYIEATWCSSGASSIPSPWVYINSSSQWHRDIVMGWDWYANHREVGVGYDAGSAAGFSFMAAPRDGYDRPQPPPSGSLFVTGVAFADTNANGRMDLGEGLSGVAVTVGTATTSTNAGGGYSIPADPGTYTVSAPGAGTGSVSVVDTNVSVDFVTGRSEPIVRMPGTAARWAGPDRYATAVEVSRAVYPSGAAVAYVAVGTNFPDAIAAGPAAAAESAPILLTRIDSLHPLTAAELRRLGPATVVVTGGTAAISDAVLAEIRSLLPSAQVVRRWGPDRYGSAVAMSESVFGPSTSTVYVATGLDFPDALVAAPAAVANGAPLLLVRTNDIPAVVRGELARLRPTEIVVVGGRTAVADSVLTDLRTYASTVRRIDGTNRYDIAVAVSAATFGAPATTVYIAVGTNFPDALTGGGAGGVLPGPILLVPSNDVPDAVSFELRRLAPHRIVILGGTAVIPTGLAAEISRYIA